MKNVNSIEKETKIRNDFEFRGMANKEFQRETKLWVLGGRKLDNQGNTVLNPKYENQNVTLLNNSQPREKRNSHKRRGWINYKNQVTDK